MNCISVLEIESKDSGVIFQAIKPELKEQVSSRSKVQIKAAKDKLVININASDVNALRAASNNILRLIDAAEKSIMLK